MANATRRNHFSTMFIFQKNQKTYIKTFVSIFVPPEGNFDIDAGDGDGGGDHLGSQNQTKSRNNISYKNCSHFWDIFQKMSKMWNHTLKNVHIYRKS